MRLQNAFEVAQSLCQFEPLAGLAPPEHIPTWQTGEWRPLANPHFTCQRGWICPFLQAQGHFARQQAPGLVAAGLPCFIEHQAGFFAGLACELVRLAA